MNTLFFNSWKFHIIPFILNLHFRAIFFIEFYPNVIYSISKTHLSHSHTSMKIWISLESNFYFS